MGGSPAEPGTLGGGVAQRSPEPWAGGVGVSACLRVCLRVSACLRVCLSVHDICHRRFVNLSPHRRRRHRVVCVGGGVARWSLRRAPSLRLVASVPDCI